MKNVIVFLLSVSLPTFCIGIECEVCGGGSSSGGTENCSITTKYVSCPSNQPFCHTTSATVGLCATHRCVTDVWRGCFDPSEVARFNFTAKTNDCTKYTMIVKSKDGSAHHVAAETCLCDKDLCNKGARAKSASSSVKSSFKSLAAYFTTGFLYITFAIQY